MQLRAERPDLSPFQLPLAAAATQLLAEARRTMPSPCRLVEVLQSEAELARCFRILAGSPLLGDIRGHESCGELVLRLDPGRLELVASAAVVLHALPVALRGEKFDHYGFWSHAAATGALARTLAREVEASPTLAFVAGLLHDIGRVVLHTQAPRSFAAVAQYQRRHDVWIRDAERMVLGFDHCAVGERAARAWALPESLIEPIGSHHEPERSRPVPPGPITLVVHVADVLARGLQIGSPGDDTLPMLSETALRQLGLDWWTLRDCLRRAEADLEEAAELVSRLARV
jgi:putative nucleotidyltransferase with HDIG domain